MNILNDLLHHPKAKFAKLQPKEISSDHFSYHLQNLVKIGMVQKEDAYYNLTSKGKEFANRMDTQVKKLEKQPKVAVLIVATKNTEGNRELLIQTRTKEPYYGYKGFITGKVRFGEKLVETASRELREETGLRANFELKYILHEHIYSTQKDLLEDKIFHVFIATNPKGKLISTIDGNNEWMKEKDFRREGKVFYDEIDILDWIEKPESFFIEREFTVSDF